MWKSPISCFAVICWWWWRQLPQPWGDAPSFQLLPHPPLWRCWLCIQAPCPDWRFPGAEVPGSPWPGSPFLSPFPRIHVAICSRSCWIWALGCVWHLLQKNLALEANLCFFLPVQSGSCTLLNHSFAALSFSIIREYFPWSCSGPSSLQFPPWTKAWLTETSTKLVLGGQGQGQRVFRQSAQSDGSCEEYSTWSFTVRACKLCSCSDGAPAFFSPSYSIFCTFIYRVTQATGLHFPQTLPEPCAVPAPFWCKSTLLLWGKLWISIQMSWLSEIFSLNPALCSF